MTVRTRRLLVALLCVLSCGALTAAPAASALPASFGGEGTGAGEMVEPRGIAVEQESGDVYVADEANNRIDKFGPEGEFLLAWGWGVADGSTKALQTCTTGCFAGLSGSGAGQFKGAEGIAVDSGLTFSHGDVYVADTRNSRVEKFGPQGEFLLMFGGNVNETKKTNVCTKEDIEEHDVCGEGVPGEGFGFFQSLTKHAAAVDQATGTVYVADQSRVQRFSEAGAVQSEVGFPIAGFSQNLAVDSAKDIYLKSEELAGVRKYDPTGTKLGSPRDEAGHGESEAITVGPADELFVNDFHLPSGPHHIFAFNAEGEQTASFDAGGQAQDGERGIASSEHVKAIYVLTAAAVRIVTPPPPGPLMLPGSESASKVEATTAVLNATINPEGAATEYHFEYGTTTAYGESTPVSAPLTAVNEVQSVTVAATGGGFTLAFKGERSGEIPFNASAAEVEAALGGIPGLGAGQVAVTGEPGGPWSVEFTGARAGENAPELSADPENLTGPEPSATVATTTPGLSLFDDRGASAAIKELQPGTLYHFRVVATNGSQTTEGPDQTFMTLPPVSIDATSASEVGDKSARLEAELNPHGVASEYHFEYDTTPYLEGEGPHGRAVPIPDGSAGAGTTDTTVSNLIQGLTRSTVYHYRVIAHNGLGEVQGLDHTFTTQGFSSTLPDGRAWELASPPNKHGAPLQPITEEGGLIQTAPGGAAFAYVAIAPIGEESKGVRSPEDSQLLSRRDPIKGWSTEDVSTPHEEISLIQVGFPSEYRFFAEDLSAGVVEPKGATPLSPQTTERTPYRREADGEFVALVTAANVPAGTKFGGEETEGGERKNGVEFITATPDLSHIVLSSPQVLAAGFEEAFVPEGRANLYELSGGALRLISVLPDGKPAAEEGDKAALGGNEGKNLRGAISSDGGRVFFNDGRELLMRDVALGKTLQLDKAQSGASGKSGSGGFQAASSDGSRVFFTDTSRLTKDASAAPNKPDLYMCEILVSGAGEPTCTLSDLSVDPHPGEAANVLGLVSAIDQGGGHVYFAASGVLTSAPNAQGERAVAGGPNMYEYDTGSREIHLVAVLSGNDQPDWNEDLSKLTARSSPDGRYFAFMSQRSLTGYDNRDARSGQPDAEVYLFDASGDSLRCVSCDPSGARPVGVFDPPRGEAFPLLVDHRHSWEERWLAGSVPGWTAQSNQRAAYQSRYVSDSGRTFFNAVDALVPQDTNKLEDVYQYEPPGVGDCSSASVTFSPVSAGCVSLISSGASKEESAFLDASENGDEVFFLTASRLTSSDVDGAFDVYDAHVCGDSSPCPPPPPAIPGCEGDACQSLSSPPTEITPGSLTYKGPGNARPPAARAKAKPTRAQLLKQALMACKKKKRTSKRLACEKQARRKYGAKKASVKKVKKAAPLHAPSTAANPPSPVPPILPGAAPAQKAPLASPSNGFLARSVATAGSAQAAGPWWHLTSRQVPAHIAPGGEGKIIVQAINLGNAPTSGKYEFSDVLPPGMMLQEVEYYAPFPSLIPNRSFDFAPFGYCKTTPSTASCSTTSPLLEEFGLPAEEIVLKPAASYELLEMRLKVKDEGAEPGALNEFSASGGGTATATARRSVAIGDQPAGFGVGEFTLAPEEEGGGPDTHAGSHPYQLTNTLAFNRDKPEPFNVPAPPRNLRFKLPPGQIGNATALPQCNDQDFAHVKIGGVNLCPSDTAIGVAVVTIAAAAANKEDTLAVPIFNLTPAQGEPARFGFEVSGNPVILDTAVRSGPGEDYGVTVRVNNITEVASFISATASFWGVPGDPSHNSARSWGCLQSGEYHQQTGLECQPSNQAHPSAFLTLPANCEQPYAPTLDGVSWPTKAAPGGFNFGPLEYPLQDGSGDPLKLTGCNQLAFGPAFTAEPTTDKASAPSGLDVNLRFDDEGLTNATGVAQSQIKDTSVALPEGFTVNPSSGVGLGGCTSADYARETVESPPGAGCPNNSKLGTVDIETPLLTQKIHGSLFIAQPHENPFGSLIALYIVAKNPETGILIKLAGKVTPNPVTGQLVTTFENNPQLPFSHFNFHFREGQQAPLITPPTCGTYTTQAVLTPWSDPTAPLTDLSSFPISKGFDGGACPSGGAPPFAPQIAAGTVNNTAGAFSPFHLRLTRTDAEGEISAFSTALPPGLVGVLAGIPFCPEANIAQARARTGAQENAEPSCPQASLLGHSLVGTGVGAVLAYTPGKIYLAGPYNGDPFALVSVTSAVVGPFDLGTVVVRFGLRIDPRSAEVSVDPTASEPIPHIIQGIVTHVRDIRVRVDRPNFTFNPTSCNPMAISSTLASNFGQSATISSPFQAASCANLKFTPTLAVTTAARASKATGASLNFKIAYPKGAMGSQSWFNEAKFDIPRQLPARLTTIQQACPAATFEHNRGACPPHSIIGHAIVHTPVLPVPLEGPVYFVSYGGAAFPDAVLVLDGYGIHIELHGNTFINGKTSVTSATFKNTPDVPFESIEVSIPTGPFSEFGANLPASAHGSFCGQKLVMPTFFKAQNGLEIHQNTPVGVTGCPKGKTRAQKLAAALKACHKKHNKAKRASCEKTARKAYGAKVPRPHKK
jgi:DNA-binding beta-propeller fold protein YncE